MNQNTSLQNRNVMTKTTKDEISIDENKPKM